MVFLPAKIPELFIFVSVQLVQLGEESYTQFNVVIKTNELEDHQDSPAVGMQLSNRKLMELKDNNKKRSMGNQRPAFSYSSKTMIVSSTGIRSFTGTLEKGAKTQKVYWEI